MITAYEINKEILLQIAILETQDMKPYIIEMPLEYGDALINEHRIANQNVKLQYKDKFNYMGIKVYFGGKGINVCGKAYKS